MFPSRSRLAVALVVGLAGASMCAAAPRPATFEVAGTLDPVPSGLAVRATLRNIGAEAAAGVRVHAELLGARASAEAPGSVAPGAAHEAALAFPDVVTVPGVHALLLRLDYDSMASAAASTSSLSQWAYLLLAFGAAPAPAVHVELPAARFSETARVPVKLRSADGRPHRVRLSLYVPRGLAAVPHRQTVEVPASGDTVAAVRLFRALAAPHTTHGLLAVAVAEDGPAVQTSAATAVADVTAPAALLPRLRVPLMALVVALVVAALSRSKSGGGVVRV